MDETKFYDLTQTINPDITVFPGDPVFKCNPVTSLDQGAAYNLCCWQLGNHTGTHVDFPSHVIKGGKTRTDYPLDYFSGAGAVLQIPSSETSIKAKYIIENKSIFQNDIVFFKTGNSQLQKQKKFSDKFVYLEPDAAKELVKKGVKIVGIDYLSVDAYTAEDLPTHKELLSNNVLIVENLNLAEIPEGRYEFNISPLKVENADGAPATVSATLRMQG